MHYKQAWVNTLTHGFAAGAALYYAWLISQSAYVKTGFQFIMPVVIIMLVHLLRLVVSRNLSAGFSSVVYKRSAQTAIGMAVIIFVSSVVAPLPANAAGSEIASTVFTVVFCVAIIAIIVGIVTFVLWAIFKLISSVFNRSGPHDPESRLFDFGSLMIAGVFLGLFSFEGHPKMYAFDAANRSTASQYLDATPKQVWQTMEQATSPDFPLPDILGSFPQPTEVTIDQGTSLGALRQVEFSGREGVGHLTLRVVERTGSIAIFEVLSDTSPFANWVAHQRLIYEVLPERSGTRLNVTLEYERLLAPSWFFSPMTNGASYLAMDVLARDVKARAESQFSGS